MSFWFRSDWVNPYGSTHYNWIDFAVIHLSGEYDNRFGNIEFHAALLGFHIGGQWKVGAGDEDLQESLRRMMSELDSGDAWVSISLSEYNDLKRRAAGEVEE